MAAALKSPSAVGVERERVGTEGHTRGGDIYCVDLPRVEGMNLRRDVRAGVQRRRRRVSGTAAGMPAPHFDSSRGLRMRLLMAGRLVHTYRRS